MHRRRERSHATSGRASDVFLRCVGLRAICHWPCLQHRPQWSRRGCCAQWPRRGARWSASTCWCTRRKHGEVRSGEARRQLAQRRRVGRSVVHLSSRAAADDWRRHEVAGLHPLSSSAGSTRLQHRLTSTDVASVCSRSCICRRTSSGTCSSVTGVWSSASMCPFRVAIPSRSPLCSARRTCRGRCA